MRIKCIDAYGKIKESYLCERVTDPERIRSLERRSENWRLRGRLSRYDYYILEQLNANMDELGVYKIVQKSHAKRRGSKVSALAQAWLYFKRRR